MSVVDVPVPDIGDFKNVPVVELLVKPGDIVKADDPLVTLESDKATLEVPSPSAGRVIEILLKVGDKVSKGSHILRIEAVGADGAANVAQPTAAAPAVASAAAQAVSAPNLPSASAIAQGTYPIPGFVDFANVNASPSIRRIARELDIDLTKVNGTGEKGRITKDDVKRSLGGGPGSGVSGGMGIPEIPAQDFTKFGATEVKPMSRIQRLSGPFLHRSWLNIPHVTHTDEADITQLEERRKEFDNSAKAKGYRVTLCPFC